MNLEIKTNLFTFFFLLFFVPVLTLAQQGTKTGNNPTVTPTGGTGITYVCNRGASGECTFEDVILAIKHLTNWGVTFALSFSVIVIAWAGGIYLRYADNASKRADANKMFVSVAWGIVFVMAAWLIVNLITNALIGQSLSDVFNPTK